MIVYCIVTSFLNVVASVVLGLSVLFRDPRKQQNQLFWWFTASFAAWSFFYLRWQLSPTGDIALLNSRLLLGCSTFIPITYFHFVAQLTGRTAKREIRIGYLCAVVIASFTPTPYLVSHVEPEMMFPWWPKGGPVFIPYILLFGYFTVRAWMVLYSAFRASSHTRRNQLGYVCLSTILGWLGGLTNFLLWFDVPVPPIGNGLALIYIMGVGYAMIRFRLVQMNRLAVRLVAYGGIVAIAAPVIPVVFHTASALLNGRQLDAPLMAFCSVFITGALFLAFHFLKPKVDDLLATTVLRDDYRGRNQLRAIEQRLTAIVDEDEMFDEVTLAVMRALDTEGAAIVARGELDEACAPKAVSGFSSSFRESYTLPLRGPLVQMLEHSPKALLLDEIESGYPPDVVVEANELRSKYGVAAVVPLHADSVFYGALLLKPRARHRLFSGPDLLLLEAIGLQIGLNLRSRQLERRASQTEKLISLGTLAAGLAHELRNPLTSIQTFAALLHENTGDADFQKEFSEVMQRDVARIVGIVENISSFATRNTVKLSFVQIGEIIKAAREITDSRFRATGVTLDFSDSPVPPVYGNYNQLLQVFINLFQNAMDALGGRVDGRIEVRLRERTGWTFPAVEISIRDNGPGVDAQVLARIFDPFVTTKDTGARTGKGGTGLGLSIVKRVVDNHRGVIRAISNPGVGTEFLITLPTNPSVG